MATAVENSFTSACQAIVLEEQKLHMRLSFSVLASLLAVIFLASGCAGPERKFGRGMLNATEFARLGEIRRSMEQTALWESGDAGYTTGFMKGLNRSLARTAVGAYEMVTFPLPPYDPIFLPEYPVYPDSYKPRMIADPTFGPDASLGFSGGDIAPMVPGSRFRIFDY
jgi:putative exosortase-associated protein (TIGR04073 family)